jgi:hypothetical protein
VGLEERNPSNIKSAMYKENCMEVIEVLVLVIIFASMEIAFVKDILQPNRKAKR